MSTSTSGGAAQTTCQNPEIIYTVDDFGEDSGFVRCADGSKQREHVVACNPVNNGPACQGDEDFLNCQVDADCGAGPNGRCIRTDEGFGIGCNCEYTCATDADCGDDDICVCNAYAGRALGPGQSM